MPQFAMTEFSVKSVALFMWWRVIEACSQIRYLTGKFNNLGDLSIKIVCFYHDLVEATLSLIIPKSTKIFAV